MLYICNPIKNKAPMDHCFNLLKLAAKVEPEKVNKGTYYNNLIAAFRGADTLTSKERSATIKVIEREAKRAVELLRGAGNKIHKPSKN